MHEFGVSLRLWKMIFMVFRLKKVFGKGLKYRTIIGMFWVVVRKLDLES